MTLTYISRSSDFYTFYVDVPLSLGCIIRKVSAEDIAIRGNGTGLEYMCPTRHFVYIFFNPVFQLSTAKNEINLFNNHVLIVAPVTFTPAGAMTPSAEFLFLFLLKNIDCGYLLELPHWGSSNEYPQSMFLSRNMKTIRIFHVFYLSENFHFLVVKFSVYLNRHVFVINPAAGRIQVMTIQCFIAQSLSLSSFQGFDMT